MTYRWRCVFIGFFIAAAFWVLVAAMVIGSKEAHNEEIILPLLALIPFIVGGAVYMAVDE